MVIEIFKIVNDLAPSYWSTVFEMSQSQYDMCDKSRHVQPKVNSTSYGLKSFKYYGSHIWNLLPMHIKSAMSLPEFKASNYRPVSLTWICSKLLEHILVSNIMKHLENNILCDRQHGFRIKLSCETQLFLFQQELLEAMEEESQTDVIIMDFSKAFGKGPHQRPMDKITYYGVNDQVASWIQCFLAGRRQWVVVGGE